MDILIAPDQNGPVFAGPWQARAFALAVRLSAECHFTWKEWAATLADAYRHMPHGKPVELIAPPNSLHK